ncbi:hypothetical protein A3H03_02790 [Candidatus Kuenenbacteria bacterium RIFCSPLOWO2_12_FULL_42_13]|uniref:Zn-dependent hydrolase of the beta-lactamase fold-like protein n=5 Tax=Candidatus Kueneniibacteriota TaxID=1752740 RepID=A0A0G0YUZ3_9BACT|nr:MAG: hypothetical protein UV02_C0041G0004 [Candidatus Kuenenbacteria bacterium GW2011_GWA2_42_15]OGG90002.1 MAG: hypothetical protein A3C68_01110 [Candidatus Kuenenbacteria bacterium RIFCSPHIGHO2_02_FULL_42_29]OGG91620.1 MAG: hypothetical protein A3H55_00540 [Candidatus Kuenenbacteria bacterium RIFCSPLOWO2_02_FULL_42_16]OGG91889.1 MAG: hypothetical protein A3H03_02790 [Candidatus Kuenenbacteria bacterium RIFCSPLOWO2_12_FULL_42_13]OGG95870.1 MAG: hypothetical protein A2V95_01835 [Candidatus K
MTIQWLGNSCFKIQTKSNGGETTILTDPYAAKCGLPKMKFAADIVVLSREDDELIGDLKDFKGTEQTPKPFIVKSPGEYELQGSFVYGLSHSAQEKNTLYVLSVEDMKIGFLGLLNKKELTASELESIEGVDILFVPISGEKTLTAADAARLVNQIEPRIVIPMCYKIPGLALPFDAPDRFVKEMGNHEEELDKLKISKKDLPPEETRLILLKP